MQSNASACPPGIARGWALFLDFDGTLVDIAPRPDAVAVQPGLVPALAALAASLDGAVAIVSGRPAADVDRLLAPLALPGGFGHGAELRLPNGELAPTPAARPLPPSWLDRLSAAAAGWPGVLVEPKQHGVAMHYRQASERRDDVLALLEDCVAEAPDFALLPAHMAFELRPRGATKALPVGTLMQHPPFHGRLPVFVGDDVTDEDGMAAARRLGGFGLRVGSDFTDPAEVRAWLARGAA